MFNPYNIPLKTLKKNKFGFKMGYFNADELIELINEHCYIIFNGKKNIYKCRKMYYSVVSAITVLIEKYNIKINPTSKLSWDVLVLRLQNLLKFFNAIYEI